MYLIDALDIIKEYEGHRALNGVSVQIPENCIYGILGPNGAGKTTFIRIINHITVPDSGSVLFDNHLLNAEDVKHIGYLPEERGLYKKMKVGEHIVYLAQVKGVSRNEAKRRMKKWITRFEIDRWEKYRIEELSKGMQQKIQFITTVIHEPRLLIFDEPFSGFDPINTELLKREILELKKGGATIIFSTHNMSSVEELCDEITLINRSQVVLQGEVLKIREQYKKDLFRIKISSGKFPSSDNHYIVISEKEAFNGTEILLKKTDDIPINDLIVQLAERFSLTAFEEILPSMNEIFIETVEREKTL